MKKYEIRYWEKESVWVRRRTIVEANEKPTIENVCELLESGDCDYLQSDYAWETAEHECYDFETDLEVEEVK